MNEVEKHLQKHWDKTFTTNDLVKLGFGSKDNIHYRLNNSKYIYKVSFGVYQFTAWRRKGFKSVKDAVLDALQEEGFLLVDELAKRLMVEPRTIDTAVNNLRKEGIYITRQKAYSLG